MDAWTARWGKKNAGWMVQVKVIVNGSFSTWQPQTAGTPQRSSGLQVPPDWWWSIYSRAKLQSRGTWTGWRNKPGGPPENSEWTDAICPRCIWEGSSLGNDRLRSSSAEKALEKISWMRAIGTMTFTRVEGVFFHLTHLLMYTPTIKLSPGHQTSWDRKAVSHSSLTASDVDRQ